MLQVILYSTKLILESNKRSRGNLIHDHITLLFHFYVTAPVYIQQKQLYGSSVVPYCKKLKKGVTTPYEEIPVAT